MTTALVISKFFPFHLGHADLIEFALSKCDIVMPIVCTSNKEWIAEIRYNWVKEYYKDNHRVNVIHIPYDEEELSCSSVPSRDISLAWSNYIKSLNINFTHIVSSEKYGDYVAEYMNIKHIMFDPQRIKRNISATEIRNNPYKHWEHLPDVVKDFFYQKICILGTESTGKTTLVKNLGEYYNCDIVLEAGRDLVENTNICTFEMLKDVAEEHAKRILVNNTKNKLLVVDTDLNITKSYSNFLFNKELIVDDYIINEANLFDIYFYLENDAP